MSVVNIEPTVFEWTAKIVVSINIVLFVLISVYHIISIKKHSPHQLNYKQFPLSLKLSFVLLILTGWILMNLTFDLFDPFESAKYCYYAQYMSVTGYTLFKLIIYLTLIVRVHESFKTSFLAYNAKRLQLFAILLILWTIFGVIFNVIFGESRLDLQSYPHCIITYKPYTLISVALLDVFAGSICSYLFIKPVRKLYKELSKLHANSNGNVDNNNKINDEINETNELKTVALKQCILSIITICTTLITVIFVALTGMRHVFGSMDINVSYMCIILMYRWNNRTVEAVFCCCLTPQIEHLKMMSSNSTVTKESKETNELDAV